MKNLSSKTYREVMAAAADERTRFNQALANGAVAVLQSTFFGPYRVTSVDEDFWYHTYPMNQVPDQFNRRSFAGCNDGTWANLLEQAHVERNARWLERREPMRGVQNDDDSTRDMWNAPRAKR